MEQFYLILLKYLNPSTHVILTLSIAKGKNPPHVARETLTRTWLTIRDGRVTYL